MGNEEANEAAIRGIIGALNRGDLEGASAPIADDCVVQIMNGAEPMVGRDAYCDWISHAFETFADFSNELTNVVACGDTVVIEYLARGKLRREYHGIQPSGRAMSLPEIMVYEFEGGKVRRVRSYFDPTVAARQLSGQA